MMKERLDNLQKNILNACLRVGRSSSEVRILLATKTVSTDIIGEVVKQGYSLLGENKVQELLEKVENLKSLDPEWHLIGHLQTNKVKAILPYISCLHSVDRWSLVQELDKRLNEIGKTLDILVQVNTSEEESKFGLSPEEVLPFLEKLLSIKNLNVKGFMTLAAFSSDPEISRVSFKLLKKVQAEAESKFQKKFPELSMGMSNDYQVAIEEGATIIRVGTTIFGQRTTSDSYYWPEQK